MNTWDENDAFEAAAAPAPVPLSQRAMASRGTPYLDDLNPAQREAVVDLKNRYEAPWGELLTELHAAVLLRGDPALARLLMFGALNWSAQWFDPARRATLDDVADAALQLFLKEPA